MNVEEYISSGILEAYVLGDLPPEEAIEVSRLAKEHSEIKEEISKIEISLEQTAFEMAVKPPSRIKEKILDEINDSPEKARTIKLTPTTSNYFKYLSAASVVLAVVAGLLAYSYYNKWQTAEGELTALIAQNQQIAEDYSTVRSELENIEQNFQIVNNADYQRVVMNGTDNSPQSLAYVYWNEESDEVYLSVGRLSPLPDEQQYQLWAIVDGQPVDAGVFDLESSSLVSMKNIAESASAFAVTIEPRGGSSSPTLETMQVLGNV